VFILTLDSNDPFFNLSAEEYFLCEKDEDFFLLWQNEPCIVIGRNQNAADEINGDYVRTRSLPVVRRMTGGGAVYHDRGNLNFSFIQNGEPDRAKLCRPVIEVLRSLGVEAESHLIVLEAAVHGVDPGGAVGQHAGFPAGNSTACQVQLAITASAVTSAAMCRNFFCSGLGAFCCVQGLILRAQWGQKDAPSGRGTLQSGQRFCFSEVILDSFIFKMPPSDEERFYTAWRG
jgi:hypothetical protein